MFELHPHPCLVPSLPPNTLTPPLSLSGDSEGIILILQNAQQLIKSRSPSAFGFFCM